MPLVIYSMAAVAAILRIATAPGEPIRVTAATTAAVYQTDNTVVQLPRRDGDNCNSRMAEPAVVATNPGTSGGTTALDPIPSGEHNRAHIWITYRHPPTATNLH